MGRYIFPHPDGGWELGVVKARGGEEWGKGMNLVLKTKGFTIDVQCWQAMVCQTSPYPHVLGQNQLCSIVWLSRSNTGWIKIEESVSRGDVSWCTIWTVNPVQWDLLFVLIFIMTANNQPHIFVLQFLIPNALGWVEKNNHTPHSTDSFLFQCWCKMR